MYINQLSGYNFIYDNFWDNIGWSRQIIMIKKEIEYSRRSDLEIFNQAIIWVEIPLKNTPNLLIAGGYRQWKLPKEVNIPNSNSPKNQKGRWDDFLTKYQLMFPLTQLYSPHPPYFFLPQSSFFPVKLDLKRRHELHSYYLNSVNVTLSVPFDFACL